MTHVGDPDTWYHGKYADTAKFGTRDEHYAHVGRAARASTAASPWLGAHLGGNPEDLAAAAVRCSTASPNLYARLQRHALDGPRDQRPPRRGARVLHPQPGPHPLRLRPGQRRRPRLRLPRQPLVGHRKLWETAYIGPSPIFDPDLPAEQQPDLRGLALSDGVLQKLYHDNAIKLLARVGTSFQGWG